MESTGVYWILCFRFWRRGEEVCSHSRHVKHVPGRKSDVADCQWLQYLHSVGLLRASFRPQDAICVCVRCVTAKVWWKWRRSTCSTCKKRSAR